MYLERTVYPQIDISIGNILHKTVIFIVNPDLLK